MNSIHESYFLELTAPFLGLDTRTQSLSLSLTSENSTYIRFNQAKVRQSGRIEDAILSLRYQERATEDSDTIKEATAQVSLCGELGNDRQAIRAGLEQIKLMTRRGPHKPFATWISRGESSSSIPEVSANLPSAEEWCDLVLPPVEGLDFTGILSSGRMLRASRNSLNHFHWFETESATLDYSLISSLGRAVKSEFTIPTPYSREHFLHLFHERILREKEILAVLERPAIQLSPGEYRCFLGPSAVQDLVQMFSWGCVGEDGIRQGTSPLKWLRSATPDATHVAEQNKHRLSHLFSLHEDFQVNALPRFNERGEIAPKNLNLISNGELKNTWISNKTAKEWGLISNGASGSEGLRAPLVLGGKLNRQDTLSRLGTGVYIPNLHYLNWSDQPAGRITGMTRHACVWVEQGVAIAPIQNMRWDDTLFRIFGSELEDLTSELTTIPDTGSYDYRSLGNTTVPGALLRSLRFTL